MQTISPGEFAKSREQRKKELIQEVQNEHGIMFLAHQGAILKVVQDSVNRIEEMLTAPKEQMASRLARAKKHVESSSSIPDQNKKSYFLKDIENTLLDEYEYIIKYDLLVEQGVREAHVLNIIHKGDFLIPESPSITFFEVQKEIVRDYSNYLTPEVMEYLTPFYNDYSDQFRTTECHYDEEMQQVSQKLLFSTKDYKKRREQIEKSRYIKLSQLEVDMKSRIAGYFLCGDSLY